jgi:hypothetical protein
MTIVFHPLEYIGILANATRSIDDEMYTVLKGWIYKRQFGMKVGRLRERNIIYKLGHEYYSAKFFKFRF